MVTQHNGVGKTYLYAVIPGPADERYGPIGIEDGPVHCISQGAVAAVVSETRQTSLRPQRQHLAAHQRVLTRLMQTGAVMPMSFGVMADGPDDVRRILAENEDTLTAELQHVNGRVEMGLRVRWDVPNLFEYLVGRHEELRDARDRAFCAGHEPDREEQMALGRLVERLLGEDRAAAIESIEESLRPHCAEIREGKRRDERELVNFACLIERGSEDAFAQGVVQAASGFDSNYCFDYHGPMPPHSFVDVHLQW
jgi:hypothetical protein